MLGRHDRPLNGSGRMSDNPEESQRWLRQLAEGDDLPAQQFITAFRPALQRIAANRMTPALGQRMGPGDVFQSICRTLFRRTQEGRFLLPERESLWRLLCAITLNKVRLHAGFYSAEKHGSLRSAVLDDEAQIPEISVEEAVEFADELRKLLESLGETEGQLVWLKLEGSSHAEIAERLRCTERTVGRLLVRARAVLDAQLEE